MEQTLSLNLNEAALAGDIDALYASLRVDPFILDNIDKFPFCHTPMHVAALAGQTSFVLELAILKPSFIRKLNQDGFSPIHLASSEGHVEIVKELLGMKRELGRLKGREWRTPLHCASIAGRVQVIGELLSACPESVEGVSVRRETALHLALKHGQMVALGVLVEGIQAMKKEEILNWKDNQGNTILHLAASRRQLQVIELLFNTDRILQVVEINATNAMGLTSLDVLRRHSPNEESDVEIENILRRAGAVGGQDIVSIAPHFPSHQTITTNSVEGLIVLEKLFQGFPLKEWAQEIEDSPSETRSTLMVVAVLIATVTFQAILSPPGGFNSSSPGRLNMVETPMERFIRTHSFFSRVTCIGVDSHLFLVLYSITNSIGFITSVTMITVLTRGFPLKALLRIAVLSMAATYLSSVIYIEFGDIDVVNVVSLLMLTAILVQWIHLKLRSLRRKNSV